MIRTCCCTPAMLAAMVILCLVSAATSLRAGTVRDDRNPQSYLRLGASSDFASVGLFDGVDLHNHGFTASGTLVDDDWVLTAGHVVDDAASLNFVIGGGADFSLPGIPFPPRNGEKFDGYHNPLVAITHPRTS